MDILILILEAAAFLVVAVLLLWSTKSFFLVYEKWIDREKEVSSVLNTAEAIRRAGLFIGSAVALSAPLINGSHDTFSDDIIITIIDAVGIMGLMLVSITLNDKVLIPHIDNGDAVASDNITFALIKVGAYFATGLVLFGSFVGSGPWLSSIVFFLLTQILLWAIVRLYEWQVSFDFRDAVTNNNSSAGIILAAMMISYGVILSSVVSGDFISWERDLYDFFVTTLIAVSMIVIVFNSIIDRIFLPGILLNKAIEQKNVSTVIIAAALKISLSIIIAQVIA